MDDLFQAQMAVNVAILNGQDPYSAAENTNLDVEKYLESMQQLQFLKNSI